MRFLRCAVLAAAALLSFTNGPAAYAEAGTENWFADGLGWYQHPCGFQAFVKYGKTDTPEIRHGYYTTIKHPELCGKLFP